MNRLMIGALLLTAFGALNTQPAYEEETTAKEKTEEIARPLEKRMSMFRIRSFLMI
ncbi:hypothetical protein GTW56_07530 [Bacillus sp. EB93]|nr:hypothetical protein [Peribacillus frigoritolerans]